MGALEFEKNVSFHSKNDCEQNSFFLNITEYLIGLKLILKQDKTIYLFFYKSNTFFSGKNIGIFGFSRFSLEKLQAFGKMNIICYHFCRIIYQLFVRHIDFNLKIIFSKIKIKNKNIINNNQI